MSFLQSKDYLNILAVGDPHISGKNPLARKDNVIEVQFDKLEQVVHIANENNAHVFFVGDIFDYPYVGYGIYSRVAEILSHLGNKGYLVYGQHDLFFHNINSKISTATGSLEFSKLIHPISEFNKDHPQFKFDFLNWGEKLIKTDNEFFISHKPIVPKRMVLKYHWLRATQEKDKYLILEDLNKYKLALCGDWHKSYIVENKNTLLINPGTMVRREASEDERTLVPSVILIDLISLKYRKIELEHEKDVFSFSHLILKKKTNEYRSTSKEFIEKLKERKGNFKGSNFLKKLLIFINSKELNKTETKLMEQIIEKSFGKEYKKKIGEIDDTKRTKRSGIIKVKIRRIKK